ncbi:30S ribosomal protein S14 [Gammaproteobacteria bacterium]|nr:30S ribosomal protein S14 [Gammaproteobacteria bacterium]
MATKSKIARFNQLQRKLEHKENQETREGLKNKVKSKDASINEKMVAMIALSKRPVDESSSRQTRRCWKCGRPKGVYRRFGLCRCCMFHAMREGFLVGVRKASW